MRAEGGLPTGGPPGGGASHGGLLLNSVKALVRHMGTFHVLGVSPQHSFSLCRISGPSSVWVHASMELRSRAVFPPQFIGSTVGRAA